MCPGACLMSHISSRAARAVAGLPDLTCYERRARSTNTNASDNHLSTRPCGAEGHRTTPTPAAQGHSSKGNVSKCHAPPTALVRALEPKFSRTSLHLRTDGGMSKPRGTRRPQGVLLATRMWERVDETQRQGKLSSFQDDATASRVQRKRRGGSA